MEYFSTFCYICISNVLEGISPNDSDSLHMKFKALYAHVLVTITQISEFIKME